MNRKPPETLREAELVAAALAGDQAAWRALYLAHKDFVYRVASSFLGHAGEARDLTQDVFVQLLAEPGRYRPAARFRTWLYRVVANRCLNERAKVSHARRSDDATELHAIPDAAGTPEELLGRAQDQARVRVAIAGLPERQRLAVVLSRFEGLSYEEIAQALDTTVSSVESLLFRARENLARALAQD